ncbi:MAG: hypothetical protein WC685_08470 [Methylobacter sp.]
MATIIKFIGILFGAFLIFLFVAGYFLVSGMCANTVITSSTSPNEKLKLVLFERSCGATTGYSSQISLLESGDDLSNEPGNIYIAAGYPDNYTLTWDSNFSVKVGGSNGNSNKKVTQLNGVQFTYE